MRLRKILLGLTIVVVGLLVGFVSRPDRTDASYTAKLYMYPGVDYGGANLTCGWHTACYGSPNYERGLDLDYGGNASSRFNTLAFSHDSANTVRATGTVGTLAPSGFTNCSVTSVTVKDTSGGSQFRIYNIHTQKDTSGTFNIYAKSAGTWLDVYLAQEVNDGCAGTGLHTMMWFDGLSSVINIIGRDNWNNCPNDAGFYFPCFDVTPYALPHDFNDWTYVGQW